MGNRTAVFITAHNRQTDAGHERLCAKCEDWKVIADFKITHGYHGYACYACERDRQRHREAARPIRVRRRDPNAPRAACFAESRVDVKGLFRFSTMPTPAQLVRDAA